MSVIPSEARNLSEGYAEEKKEGFLASLGMTKSRRDFFLSLLSQIGGCAFPRL